MKAPLLLLLLLLSSVDGRIPVPSHRKFQFQFGFGFGRGNKSPTATNPDIDDYDYYDVDDDVDNQVSLKNMNVLKVACGITCASLLGCGVLYQFGALKMPKLPLSWLVRPKRTDPNLANTKYANDEESMGETIELKKKEHAEAKIDSESSTTEPSDAPLSKEDSWLEEDGDEVVQDNLEGIASALGPHLLKSCSNGTRLRPVSTTQALKGKVIALYFSSLELEKEMKDRNITRLMLGNHVDMVRQLTVKSGNKPLEMVYVSLDDNARSFRDMVRVLKVKSSTESKDEEKVEVEVLDESDEALDHESGSDWLAVPFSERKVISDLSQKFIPAEGPPQIVMVDADTGLILNRGALSQMLGSPQNFPWKAPQPLEILFGEMDGSNEHEKKKTATMAKDGDTGCSVIYPKDDLVSSAREATKEARYIGLYFSADWCTPCKTFMPLLSHTYASINSRMGKKHGLEVLYVSLDRNETDFTKFRRQMPWPAIAFDSRKRAELEQALGVRALPSLVILNKETGAVVTREGRSALMEDPQGMEFPWDESTVTELSTSLAPHKNEADISKSTKKKKKQVSHDIDDDEYDDDDDEEREEGNEISDDPTTKMPLPAQRQTPPKGLVDGMSLIVFTDRTLDADVRALAKNSLNSLAKKYTKAVTLTSNSLFTQNPNPKKNSEVEVTTEVATNEEEEEAAAEKSELMSFVSKHRLSFFSASVGTGESPILDAVRTLIGESVYYSEDNQGLNAARHANGDEKGDALFADLKAKTDKKANTSSKKISQLPSAVILDVPNRRYFKLEMGHLPKESQGVINEGMLEQFLFDMLTGKLPARPLALNLDAKK